MNQTDPKQFQRKIYAELNEKLKSSSWKSGAAEAHGLLTGLACRGITTTEIGNRMYLFQFSADEDTALLEGLFELILRELESSAPTFNLLLAGDEEHITARVDEIASWCGGFVQGFCHDGDSAISEQNAEAQEVIQDIMDICGMEVDLTDSASHHLEEEEKAFSEVEEYLRVGIQIIFDEASGFKNNNQLSERIH